MAVKHGVRSTLLCLALGVLLQRLLQLATFLCIGRALGVDRLGVYAQGIALGGLLAVLAGTGVRNLLARAIAQDPNAARSLVLGAVRARLALGSGLGSLAVGSAFLFAGQPWFWTLCVLQVLPCAFDLKNLLDVAGRTRTEVVLDTTAALLHLALVLLWIAAGGGELSTLAAIALGSKCVYAAGAVVTIRQLPSGSPARSRLPLRQRLGVAIGQTPHEVMVAGDVWIVALCLGNSAAGLYAVAARLAAAALLPSTQLARLLLPHLLHASRDGDAGRTLGTALRATLLVTLPMLAGGAAVAARLCGLSGPQFSPAGITLVVLLCAGSLQHLGWQCSNALLAAGRDAAYARGLGWPSVLHLASLAAAAFALTGKAASSHWQPPLAAALAGACAVLAHAAYAIDGLHATRHLRPEPLRLRVGGPVFVAAATGIFAALPHLCGDVAFVLPLQLASGAIAFMAGLWLVELRGRVARLGDGLASASGFRA